jgi:hypothetical protein
MQNLGEVVFHRLGRGLRTDTNFIIETAATAEESPPAAQAGQRATAKAEISASDGDLRVRVKSSSESSNEQHRLSDPPHGQRGVERLAWSNSLGGVFIVAPEQEEFGVAINPPKIAMGHVPLKSIRVRCTHPCFNESNQLPLELRGLGEDAQKESTRCGGFVQHAPIGA